MIAVADWPAQPRRLCWIGLTLAAAVLPHLTHLPFWVPVFAFTACAWRIAAALGRVPAATRWARAGLAIGALLGVLASYRTINGLQAGSALLIVMAALKLLETRTRRDEAIVVLIVYFLVFAALLQRQALWSGLYLFGVVWLTTVTLLQTTRLETMLPVRDAMRLSARLLLQAVPVMLLLFLLFPRLPGPLWGVPGANTASTGLSDEMSPGDITELGLSDDIAFRARFEGSPPPVQERYWRAIVLARFDGRTWSRGGFGADYFPEVRPTGRAYAYEVMLEPHGRRWVFGLDAVTDWPDTGMFRNSRLQLIAAQPVNDRRAIRLVSHTGFVADPALREPLRRQFLELPDGPNPRSVALGRTLAAEHDDPEAIVAAMMGRFADEAFRYTLEPTALGANPVDDFLFETREGFCEHYASAFAVVMRAAGIPTRIVTGYHGGEYNGIGRHLVIRQSEAHAWTEVWLPGRGWVRQDPVGAVMPERLSLGIDAGLGAAEPVPGRALRNAPWIGELLAVVEAANAYWNDFVLGYGPALQEALLERIGFDDADWRTLGLLLTAGLALLMAGYGLGLVRALRRAPPDPLAAGWQRLCTRLARAGLARAPGEAPVAYGRRVAAARPDLAAGVEALVAEYVRLRYETEVPAAKDVERFRQRVAELRPAPAPVPAEAALRPR